MAGYETNIAEYEKIPIMKKLTVLLLLWAPVAFALIAPNAIMPAVRQAAWQGNVGIPGGIPFYPVGVNVKNAPFNAYGDGIHDDTVAIQTAINSCVTSNRCAIYLPTGTYLVSGTLTIPGGYPSSYPSLVLRGDGPGLTIIAATNYPGQGAIGNIIYVRSGTVVGTYMPILSGLTQGSTSITVSNTTGWKPGFFMSITELNDTNFVSTDTYNAGAPCTYCGEKGQRVLQQYVMVTGVSGNTLNITPPLLWNYSASLAPTANYVGMITNCGVENLSVTRLNPLQTSGAPNIGFGNAAWCWVTNVESSWAQGDHIEFNDCFQCQVSHCYLHDARSYISGEGYGVWIFNHNSNHLIENTIFHNCRHAMVTEAGGAACVFSYNFVTNVIAGEAPTAFLSGADLQHGAHAWFILYEGNVTPDIRSDYAHGSSSHITHFRESVTGISYIEPETKSSINQDALNYLPGLTSFAGCWVTNDGGFIGAEFDTFAYSNSVIGCIFSTNFLTAATQCGYPIMFTNGPTTSIPTQQVLAGRFGYENVGASGICSDMTVGPSTYWHGNWDPDNNGVVWNPSNSDHTIPPSLYLTSAPAWWPAQLAWPPIGPDLSLMAGPIPAQVRWQQMLVQQQPLAPPTNLRIVPGS
jgi:hypothetical protein